MTYSDDFDENIRYRIAFGHARSIREEGHFSTSRHGNTKMSSREFSELLAEVAMRGSLDVRDPAVVDGVKDAVEGRKPRW